MRNPTFSFYTGNIGWRILIYSCDLQLNPGDSVMDIRQFLLDAPETCFFTCYDLLLHTKDGSTYHLEDFNEISEVADITIGGCFLEMVPGIVKWCEVMFPGRLILCFTEEFSDSDSIFWFENWSAALYDDRSIRAHVHRTRELLSLSTLHASLSTSLALQYETAQNKVATTEGLWCIWFFIFQHEFSPFVCLLKIIPYIDVAKCN